MDNEQTHIDSVIIDYLTHSLDKESKKTFEEWLNSSHKNKEYFLQQQEIWFSCIDDKESELFDKDNAYLCFRNYVKTRKGFTPFRTYIVYSWFRRSAVACILILLASVVSYKITKDYIIKDIANVVIEAPAQSNTKISLPDGTLVWMNANSILTYSSGFSITNRSIEFQGEGYFEVAHNRNLPFKIETAGLEVRVLGTKFNVRNYLDEEEAVVYLKEGKLALNTSQKEGQTILLPNERIVYNKTNKRMSKTQSELLIDTNWTKGILFFNETLLIDLAKELERIYRVKISFENDRLKRYRFYAVFNSKEQSIKEIMDILSSTHKFKYEMKDRHITLY